MKKSWLLALVLLAGCDDHLFPSLGDKPLDSEGWCAVQDVISASCLECHSAAQLQGGLDLETAPHATLLERLVVAGDPEGSVLMQRLDGTGGGVMPPSGILPQDTRDRIRAWITDGADEVCDRGVGPHPPGWAAPDSHGMGAKFQELNCTSCHGEDLEGDLGPACSSCHEAGWKENCTYCHGDPQAADGAPPEDIDDNTDLANSPFSAHRAHLAPGDHATIPCETCHEVPENALTTGHLFVGDTTPGVAEVRFLGVSQGGSWNAGSCTVKCHGNGRAVGTVEHQAGPRNCSSCHASLSGAPNTWDELSGHHEDHLDEGVLCGECHSTVAGASTMVEPEQHVDGQVQLELPVGINRTNGRCTGSCHNENHNNRSW